MHRNRLAKVSKSTLANQTRHVEGEYRKLWQTLLCILIQHDGEYRIQDGTAALLTSDMQVKIERDGTELVLKLITPTETHTNGGETADETKSRVE